MDIEQVIAVVDEHVVSVVDYDGLMGCYCGWAEYAKGNVESKEQTYDEHLKKVLREHFGK